MTQSELKDFQAKLRWLPAEHAAQWTEEVREAWLAMRKAYKDWMDSGTLPDFTSGSIKADGDLTPLFIVNDSYIKYHQLKSNWNLVHEPHYINGRRARLSAGDFEEDKDDK
jgi:hypothetical protein